MMSRKPLRQGSIRPDIAERIIQTPTRNQSQENSPSIFVADWLRSAANHLDLTIMQLRWPPGDVAEGTERFRCCNTALIGHRVRCRQRASRTGTRTTRSGRERL
jgi:hypothetical protein